MGLWWWEAPGGIWQGRQAAFYLALDSQPFTNQACTGADSNWISFLRSLRSM